MFSKIKNGINNIINPNGTYVKLFREIKADEILATVTGEKLPIYTVAVSLSDFYKFRELLISAMGSQKITPMILNNLKDYRSAFGYHWIKGVYEEAFNVEIIVTTI